MKAVIVDVNKKNAIVVSKNGEFIKIRNKEGFSVGYEIELPERRVFNSQMMIKTASIAAAFIFTIGIGYGVYSYNAPYSYINVDINPSVEIVANRYNRTLHVEAVNEDGAKILENESLRNKPVDTAVENIIKRAAEKGYIVQDQSNAVMLTVSSKNERKAEEMEKKVQEAAEAEIATTGITADVLVEKVTMERHDEARKMDISPGKLVLIEKLQDVSPEVKIDEVKKASVKEIIKEIMEKKKEDNKEESKDKKDAEAKSKEDKNGNKTPNIGDAGINKKQSTVEESSKSEDKNKVDKSSEKKTNHPTEKSKDLKDKKNDGNSKSEEDDIKSKSSEQPGNSQQSDKEKNKQEQEKDKNNKKEK